jgi:hypothetical protein
MRTDRTAKETCRIARRVVPFVAIVLAAGVTLAVAACGGSNGDSGSSAETTTAAPAASVAYKAGRAPTPRRGAPPWRAPRDPLRRTRLAGLRAERAEQLAYHVHAHLDVFVNGRDVVVPAGIGINIKDPGVKRSVGPSGGPAYGGIQLCRRPCISPLHTHDQTGVLHTESATPTPNRLGQFFTEWGVRLNRSCVGGYCRPRAPVAIFVDGRRFTGDPRSIGLADHREIAIVIGTPPPSIPESSDLV